MYNLQNGIFCKKVQVKVVIERKTEKMSAINLDGLVKEIGHVIKQIVCDVYFEICRGNEINELSKLLAYATIFEAENEENEINELSKQLAYTTISEVENEENEINKLAKQLAFITISEVENEENQINELAKQLALKSILQAENEENEIDELAKKLVSNALMEASSEVKIELAQSKQLNGQVEIADSALFEDSVPIEEIFQEFIAKGADINDISSIADKFVGNLFHGIFTKEEGEQESEISSIAKSLIENFLSTEVDDSALFARLGQIIDEVFADVDDDDVVDVENESQQNILENQQPLSPTTLEMQTQLSTLPTTLNVVTTADEAGDANSIQQQQAPPLSKWRRFKNFFTCCWRPVVYDNDY